MTDDELSDIGRAWVGDRVGTHWDGCHLENRHHGCAVARLMAEVLRLRAELAEQKRVNVQLAERLCACSEVLGMAARRGKVCQCSVVEVSA